MERAIYPWSEVIPKGGVEGTSTAVAYDSMQKTMTIKTNWAYINDAIPQIIGYAKVGTPGLSTINRTTPAKHPMFPWLRATKIVSIQGHLGSAGYTYGYNPANNALIGRPVIRSSTVPLTPPQPPGGGDNLNKQTQGQRQLPSGAYGLYGAWDQAYITILFEAPKYPILEDNNISAEYQRYVLKKYDTNIESLARKGEVYQWAAHDPFSTFPNGFPGDLLLKQAKGILSWTWMDVPEDFVMLGKLIPSNLLRATGKINIFPFPAIADTNQNKPLNGDGTPNLVQFPAGTILVLPIKTEPRSQINPDILMGLGNINPRLFPRTYDVFFSMVHFDPQPNGEAPLILPGGNPSGYQPGGNGGTQFVSLNSGAFAPPGYESLIQGHNLVPTPLSVQIGGGPPTTPFLPSWRWWAAGRSKRNPITATSGPVNQVTNPIPEENLLYSYTDLEQMFKSAV